MSGEYVEPSDGDTVTCAVDVSTIARIDSHTRSCMFWQTDSARMAPAMDAGFEKEAWLSMVLLEWGVCGQVAEIYGRPVGAALYAPPRMVSRATTFDAGPVSPDAVLLADFHVVPSCRETTATHIRATLLNAVIGDVMRRGVHALETFGRTAEADAALGAANVGGETSAGRDDEFVRPAPGSVPFGSRRRRGEHMCGPLTCMSDVDFLLAHGFEIVADDPHFPRLRLEISADHLWQADVEHALDQLFIEAAARITESVHAE